MYLMRRESHEWKKLLAIQIHFDHLSSLLLSSSRYATFLYTFSILFSSMNWNPVILFLLFFIIPLFLVFIVCQIYDKGAKSKESDIAALRKLLADEKEEHKRTNSALIIAVEARKEADILTAQERKKREDTEKLLSDIRNDDITFPSLKERMDVMWEKIDEELVATMRYNAPKAADKVKLVRLNLREWKNRCFLLESQIEVYKSLAPWVQDYFSCTMQEIQTLAGSDGSFDVDDEAVFYLAPDEYERLSAAEKYQRALDRYWNKKHSLWTAGIQYERYIGWKYEQEGYSVTYHGALKGREDLGIDLIAIKENTAHIVQCKRYSQLKDIPVRENSVAQIFGAARLFQYENSQYKAIPCIISSFQLSLIAKRFASALGVLVRENLSMDKKYPCIKCNIGAGREKIYHLPFDQQYDSTRIEPSKGEFYAATVKEAEDKGFRRARRYFAIQPTHPSS